MTKYNFKEMRRLEKKRNEELKEVNDLLKEGYDRETIALVLNESDNYVSDLMFELGY